MRKIHADIKIYGIVQGVGFRPFVHKKVSEKELCGFVRNTSYGAFLSLEGAENSIDTFVAEIKDNPPPLAFVERAEIEKSDVLVGFTGFEISKSESEAERLALISPDVAICEDCLSELFSENDRRYKHAFINCTNCGPRFSITRDIPYDRQNTTMSSFPMCDVCASEYEDIENRRYHAQPNCCTDCGPEVYFVDSDGKKHNGDAIAAAAEYIKQGKIVAVKGMGGVHLACRFDDEASVAELRRRKRRDEKPFAIMCRDVSKAKEYAVVSEAEEKLLTSRQSPIVLLRKKEKGALSHLSENGYIGIMLPYSPLHCLLLSELGAVVMTSANISELPVIYKDDEALKALSSVADGFLLNNREIHVRCDDSLVWEYGGHEYFARRSRGYVPYPITMERTLPNILACGAEQKASFALSRGNHVFPCQHIGDLKNLETLENYETQINHFEKIFDIKPDVVVCDLHPDYLSSQYAEERAKNQNLKLVSVQHHHAHMTSCMADNDFNGKCIGVVWDGTGLGTDGKSWGAEFLLGDFSGFKRCGSILPIKLPGGDRASREVYRIGQSLLAASEIECDKSIKALLASGINCPEVTSMGRLFDGVAAILGIRKSVSYEGQAAVLLEAAADENLIKKYSFSIVKEDSLYVFDWRAMIREIATDKENGVATGEIAAAFMNTLVDFATEMCVKISAETGVKTIALSGGSFQNMYILHRLDKKLCELGLDVLVHRRVSCNDEGISLGQLMIAKSMTE